MATPFWKRIQYHAVWFALYGLNSKISNLVLDRYKFLLSAVFDDDDRDDDDCSDIEDPDNTDHTSGLT